MSTRMFWGPCNGSCGFNELINYILIVFVDYITLAGCLLRRAAAAGLGRRGRTKPMQSLLSWRLHSSGGAS